jgi:ferredoxin
VTHCTFPPVGNERYRHGRRTQGVEMKVRIDDERCEGHGRCYALAPLVFQPDDLGAGTVVGEGTVPAGEEDRARLAVANCPEVAITIDEEA